MNMTDKVEKLVNGEAVVMTNAELDFLDENLESFSYVSIPNPQRLGILDAWLVAGLDHPIMLEYRKEKGSI